MHLARLLRPRRERRGEEAKGQDDRKDGPWSPRNSSQSKPGWLRIVRTLSARKTRGSRCPQAPSRRVSARISRAWLAVSSIRPARRQVTPAYTNSAKAAAETARATVGTEASKAKADAAPAGVDARRTAEGGVSVPAARYAGRWKGAIACDPLDEYAGFTSPVEISVKEDAFLVERGVRDQPGYFALRGTPERDGRLQLVGTGISNLPRHRGNPYVAGFDGRVDGDRYQAPGWLGRRRCVVSMSRADQ